MTVPMAVTVIDTNSRPRRLMEMSSRQYVGERQGRSLADGL